ncbi:MAG: lysine 2,3-aminomutase [Pseudomonadales bacterium]|nr:lysine 2,3-aminomutase [Pseudomonadales bacterium]
MKNLSQFEARQFKVYTHRQIDKIQQLHALSEEQRFEMKVVASILPFRVNDYVIEELIDWNNIPADPIFQLTFPQKEMLAPEAYNKIAELIRNDTPKDELENAINEVRQELNPHPAGQMDLNVPKLNDEALSGMQHKYRETVLFFPSQGQVCHSYCTFCFRWAQFIGDKELQFAAKEASQLHEYLKEHTEITDLLITGGDPMVMKTKNLKQYLEPLTSPEFNHIQTIRIGSKALTFWPYRFVTDSDADDLLDLFSHLAESGKHVALMAHYNHWKELSTPIAHEAIRRIRETGAQIRSQGPLLNNINKNADDWAKLWREQVKLGVIPYYMFVERDTGAKRYFEVPLAEAWNVYRDAMKKVSGLGRTARGPSMSADPGKVEIQGVTEINGEKVFVLRFIQGRNPDWVQRPFFAKYDEKATWLNHLKPAFGEEKFFFEDEFEAMKTASN